MNEDFVYPAETYLLIGKIIEAHGLKGEITIFSFSGQPENIRGYRHLVFISSKGIISSPFVIDRCRSKGKTAIVQLTTVNDRDGAEALAGMGVLVCKDQLPPAKIDEFYVYQWEGLAVITDQGRELGTISTIFSNGAQEILVVQGNATSEEYLIPVLKSIIVHQDAEKIVITPQPGLLEINLGDDVDKQ